VVGATKGESKREEVAKGLCDHRTRYVENTEVENIVKKVWGHRRSKIQLRGSEIIAVEIDKDSKDVTGRRRSPKEQDRMKQLCRQKVMDTEHKSECDEL